MGEGLGVENDAAVECAGCADHQTPAFLGQTAECDALVDMTDERNVLSAHLGRWEALLEDEDAIVAVWQALWQVRPMTTENGRATAVHALRALAREMATAPPVRSERR